MAHRRWWLVATLLALLGLMSYAGTALGAAAGHDGARASQMSGNVVLMDDDSDEVGDTDEVGDSEENDDTDEAGDSEDNDDSDEAGDSDEGNAGGVDKVMVCHRTGSESNTWVEITVGAPAAAQLSENGDDFVVADDATCPPQPADTGEAPTTTTQTVEGGGSSHSQAGEHGSAVERSQRGD